jgi:hypothetical protein
MRKQLLEHLSVVPPRQYDAGVEQAAKSLEGRYRPTEFAQVANKIIQRLPYEALLEVNDYAASLEPVMSGRPEGRNTSLARLIVRAAFQSANDEARAAHKTLPYPASP